MRAAFAGATLPARAQSDAELGQWWRHLQDPVLDGLITRALAGNLDVATAVSRIRQARRQERIAGAAGQPTLNASGQTSETQLSKNGGIGAIAKSLGGGGAGGAGPAPIGLPGTSFADFQAGFDASWELDVFGGVRRQVEAARPARPRRGVERARRRGVAGRGSGQ